MGEDGDLSLIKWEEAKKRLLSVYGIKIEAFHSWNKINELRLVANTAKHADGTSCEELKRLRPEHFTYPALKEDESNQLLWERKGGLSSSSRRGPLH